jgi:hypothetical protein
MSLNFSWIIFGASDLILNWQTAIETVPMDIKAMELFICQLEEFDPVRSRA